MLKSHSVQLKKLVRSSASVIAVVVLAIALRAAYMADTAPENRSHEWDKYVEVVNKYATTWTIPGPRDCWECYQPPLYFFGMGMWKNALVFLGVSESAIVITIQVWSFLFSAFAVLAMAAIAGTLFPGDVRREDRALFVALCACLPGVIFLSSIVGNDGVAALLGIVTSMLLFTWWRKPQLSVALLAGLSLGAGLLVKTTAVGLVGAMIVILLSRPKFPFLRRLAHLGLALAVVLALVGPYTALRCAQGTCQPIGNTDGLNPALRVESGAQELLSFNPWQIVRHPYNNPESHDERNHILWEFFYRSAFIGEYNFGPCMYAVTIFALTLGMIGLWVALYGAWMSVELRLPYAVPIASILLCTLGSVLVARIIYPFSTTQDFRYVPFIVVPVAAYMIIGLQQLPPKPRAVLRGLLWGLALCCALMVVGLIIINPPALNR